jgi:hypothetical protein
MIAHVYTVAFQGIEAREVDVQVHIGDGLPNFNVVGLGDKAVNESRERVRAALSAIGLALPNKRITVNLAPADLPKEGSHYDLPIALGLLAAILLVDEADALTQSRDDGQMHHEDRAGVNAFIRGVDRLAEKQLPAAVVLCTNRLSAIDPAVRRRAADIFEFQRPNDAQRRAVIEGPLSEAGFGRSEIDKLVQLTGSATAGAVGFTFSDLTQRLLPTLVLDAYPDRALTYARAVEIVKGMKPTPAFRDKDKG